MIITVNERMDIASTLLKEKVTRSPRITTHVIKPVYYHVPETFFVKYVKRAIDILISSVLIAAVLSWLVPVLFILIKFSSRGPLFFIQERIGLNGKKFSCIKFRTMQINKQSDTYQAVSDDKRVTKLGLVLRLTHIDELPQLINVLKNDMSIVGPRPHMVYHDVLFTSMIPAYIQRQKVKPGITGLAQSMGFHGATPDFHSISFRTRMDLFYVKKLSFLLDMKILFTTFFVSPVKFVMKRWK
ncbi:sugar transferase [Chitinophagaceae bacterium MMS25-I14]